MNQADFTLLIRATAKIYRDSLSRAFQGVVKNWRMLAVHFSYSLLLMAAMPVAGLFGPFAGGFIMGMLLAIILGQYLATVRAAVEGDQLRFSEIKDTIFELFSPVISVLFALWILFLLVEAVFGSPELRWLRAVVALFVTVFFNPIVEIIYCRPSSGPEMFGQSIEFIKENFIEWFLPVFLIGLLLAVVKPGSVVPLAVLLFTTPPLRLIENIFLAGGAGAVMGNLLAVLLFIFGLYFVLAFRGCLYLALSGSTRRKRIYQERY